MNPTEKKLYENAEALYALISSGDESVKRTREFETHNGRRSDTCFKKVHEVPDVGTLFGDLTVTGYIVGSQGGLKSFIVKCSCGTPEFTVHAGNLRRGRSTRCAVCCKKVVNVKRKKYWGYADILQDDNHRYRLLCRIGAAITRCHTPTDKNYPNYGGRGIQVCEAWRKGKEGRRAFLSHLITLNGWDTPEFDMDRIDTDKGYEPGNLRFVSRSTNMLNKRKVVNLQERVDEAERYILELEATVSDLSYEIEHYKGILSGIRI